MRQHYSEFVHLEAGGVLDYGEVAGCDEAIFVPAVFHAGPVSVSIEGTLDGVNWIVLADLQAVALTEGVPLPIPYAGCFKVLRASVTAEATVQWASRWSA